MKIDPDHPDQRLVKELVDRYEASAKRLREQLIHPSGTTDRARQWNRSRAASTLSQVEQEIASLKRDIADWTGRSISHSMKQGITVADQQAKEAGIRPSDSPIEGSFNLVDRRAVEVLAKDTVRDLYHAADSMQRQAGTALRRMAATGVTNGEVNHILTGGIIEGQPARAIRELRDSLQKVYGDKVTIIDKNGQPIEFDSGYYAKLVATTKTREAVVTARHARLQDHGLDLVVIIGKVSKNFCTAYLGKVFSLSGKSDKYPPLSSLPGGGPPFHVQCSKGTAPFVEALADQVNIDVGKPDALTNKLLKTKDQSQLQRLFQDFNVSGHVATRMKKLQG